MLYRLNNNDEDDKLYVYNMERTTIMEFLSQLYQLKIIS